MVDGRAEVFIDGGIRRGTDVLKSAGDWRQGGPDRKGILVWARGRGGSRREAGTGIFRSEIGEAMALSGCATIADIDRSLIT